MFWLTALGSGVCDGLSRVPIKDTQQKIHFLAMALAGPVFALPFYIPVLVGTGLPVVESAFWPIVSFHAVLLALATTMTVFAHQHSPLILTAPYLALTPVLLLLTAPLMDTGRPTAIGGLGVLAVASGMYLLNLQKEQVGILDPLHNIWREKGSRLMVGVAGIYSITANLDYLAMRSSNIPFYLITDAMLVALLIGALIVLVVRTGLLSQAALIPDRSPATYARMVLFGGIFALSVLLQLYALNLSANVPYVIALKRAGMVSAPLAGVLFFGERENLVPRTLGAMLMTFGASVIIAWGRVG